MPMSDAARAQWQQQVQAPGLAQVQGGNRHHEQGFQVQGASAALAVLAAISTGVLATHVARRQA